MTNFEVDKIMKTLVILCDTREKDTDALAKRLEQMECDVERVPMNVGDYTCKVTLLDGTELDFSNKVAIERKQNFDEIIQNFIDRESTQIGESGAKTNRFQRECIRANESGCKLHFVIENATWENAFNGKYRSGLHPNSLIGHLTALQVKNNYPIWFCKAETSGKLIKAILYREVKEYLKKMEVGEAVEQSIAVSGGS